MINKNIFSELFVLDMSFNSGIGLEQARAIIKEHCQIVRSNNVQAAIKLPAPDMGSAETAANKFSREECAELAQFIRQSLCLPIVEIVDEDTVSFCRRLDLSAITVASDAGWALLESCANTGLPVIVSIKEIIAAKLDSLVTFFENRGITLALTYCSPCGLSESYHNCLKQVDILRQRYPLHAIGYSSRKCMDWETAITIACSRGVQIFQRPIGINSEIQEQTNYVTLPADIDCWFKAYNNARKFCGALVSEPVSCPHSQSECPDLQAGGVFARHDLKEGQELNESDIYSAIPCQESQLSTHELRSGFISCRLTKSCAKNAPLMIDMLDRQTDKQFLPATADSQPVLTGNKKESLPCSGAGKKLISVVTPCFNEEHNVELIYEAIKEVLAPRYEYEHIFIDNLSTDKTSDYLRRLAASDRRVKVIINMRNFGHVRSPCYALHQARGDAVITIACDLQDPPALISDFLDNWEKGALLVVGVKTQSKENPLKYALRTLYYRLLNAMANVELIEHFSGYALFDRSVVNELKKVNDAVPYLRGLVSELGYQPVKIAYQQGQRKHGQTHLSFYDLFDFAMLGLTSHSVVPMRLATIAGFSMALFSLLVSLFYLIYKLIYWANFSLGTAPVVIGMFFMFSIQLMFIGLLGEYVGSTHQQVLKHPLVVEKERINFDEDES